ncbi:efflux transporter periplasmic adaptor subunit [Leptolyngbya sp. 'hensonii']|uniref:HlyD family secretion protein n=1 Tax=Leptolyngbya sp. 'hensonii' TaxID=1922337 RepID=UPI00094FC075|nr:efflux RND transporter periplasmic adaptor subunit [Leptolyngbya sp. 'hensonii']OLP16168.1 efflux transporter periplasmic adaptor subunit [Leptolyngbya sp. 'hensonii']
MQFPLIGKKLEQPTPLVFGIAATVLVGTTAAITYTLVQKQAPLPNVAEITTPVTLQDLPIGIAASGVITPVQTVNVSPKVAGRVAQLSVEQGDRVRKGQVIARMEARELEAQLNQLRATVDRAQARLQLLQNGARVEEVAQAESAVNQAEAQVEQARSRLILAAQRINRYQNLYTEGAISRDRLDEIRNESQTAQGSLEQAQSRVNELRQRLQQLRNGNRPEEIAQAEADVAEAQGRLQAVEAQYDDTFVRAPFDGIVTQKYATEGAFVTPTTSASGAASATSSTVVAVANGLEVLAEVPEVSISQVKLGQKVNITADAYPDQVFEGRVRLIAPEAVKTQNVTSFQVRVAVVTGKTQLRSGMNVNLSFQGETLANVLAVPTATIVTCRGEKGVLVPDDRNRAKFQPVVVGVTSGKQTQILQGLKSGQPVFTELPKGQTLADIKACKPEK